MNRDHRHKTAFEPYGGDGRCFLEEKYFAGKFLLLCVFNIISSICYN